VEFYLEEGAGEESSQADSTDTTELEMSLKMWGRRTLASLLVLMRWWLFQRRHRNNQQLEGASVGWGS
jgi:hypothetical protein